MSDQLGVILDFLMRPGVDYNLQKGQYWGVLFHRKPDNTLSAIVASAFFVVEMENVSVDVKGEFFYYREDKWGPSPYPRSPQEILHALHVTPTIGKVSTQLPNLLNHIGKFHEDVRKRSRIIISPYTLPKGHVVLKFVKEEDGLLKARNPKIQKPLIPVNVPWSEGIGPRNQFYTCKIVNEGDDWVTVEPIEVYGEMRLGIKYSPKGYIPDNREEINSLARMEADFVYGIHQVLPEAWRPYPTHLDCVMFYDLLKIFDIVKAKAIDISFCHDPNTMPVIIKNKKESSSDPQITILMNTLNQSYGAQRR